MTELSPIERVRRFWDCEPVDKMPFFTGMGMVLQPAIKKLGYKFPQVHGDAEKLPSLIDLLHGCVRQTQFLRVDLADRIVVVGHRWSPVGGCPCDQCTVDNSDLEVRS